MGLLNSALQTITGAAVRGASPILGGALDAYNSLKSLRPPTNATPSNMTPAQNAAAFTLSKPGTTSAPSYNDVFNTSKTSTSSIPTVTAPTSTGGGGSWSTPAPAKAPLPPNPLGVTASSPYYTPSIGVPSSYAPTVATASPIRPPATTSPSTGLAGYTSSDSAVQNQIKQMQAAAVSKSSLAQPQAPTAPVAPTAPTAPIASAPQNDNRNAQLAALQKAYLDSFNPTADETSAQSQLNALNAQGANLNASEQLGLNKIKDQAIPMDLLVGQGAALQRQVEGQQGVLSAQAQPIEAQLANLQARRASAQQAAQANIGFTQDQIKNEQEKNKPIEVNGNLVKLNPTTGQYEAVYQSDSKDAAGFTLGAGEQRYDAKGNLIASGADKPASDTNPASYKEWQLAGSPGTYQDWVMKTGNAAARPLTADQAKLIADGNNLSSVLQPLQSLIQSNAGAFGPVAGLSALNPYNTQGQAMSAQLQTASQVIGKYLEGGVLRKEDEDKYRKMLPQLTDTPAVAQQKLAQVTALVQQKQQQYLSDFGSAGFNTSGFSGQSASPTQSDPLGLGFNQESQTSLNGNSQKAAQAIGQFESGGNYKAIGPKTSSGDQAYGKYQIMGANIPQWSKEALGYSITPQQFLANPQLQDAIANHKIDQYMQKYGTVEDVASVWFSGKPLAGNNAKDVIGTSVPQYASGVRSIYNSLG